MYRLTTECSSLTVTLCVTNRKFLSLLFSILYFGNLFTPVHWTGAAILLAGTVLFASADLLCDQATGETAAKVAKSQSVRRRTAAAKED